MINVHYALQSCDTAYNICPDRFCSDSRTEVSKKCIKSFFESLKHVAESNSEVMHTARIFDDHSSKDLLDFLHKLKHHYQNSNIDITIESLENTGIMESIAACYTWLKNNGIDLVYQIQDDYLFEQDAIYQMIDMFMQIYSDLDTLPFITGYQDPYYWHLPGYKYKSTPRMVVPGKSQYWIQCYDISCSFLTSHSQLVKHWDLLQYFLSLDPQSGKLESISLNKILVQRGQLGLMPFKSITLHMQSDFERDPYIDWQTLWNKQNIEDLS